MSEMAILHPGSSFGTAVSGQMSFAGLRLVSIEREAEV